MKDLNLKQILEADFRLHTEPVIHPFHGSFVAADPSLLLPDQCKDGLWHIFFHTTFGIWHFTSKDGIGFERGEKLLSRAMRPNINYIDGKYYLFFEHTRPLIFNALNLLNIVPWRSEIYAIESIDLVRWSKPKQILGHTREYEMSKRGVSLSNPFLLRENGENRLYYSCGLTFIKDCGFCEPTYISIARSDSLLSGYEASDSPIISPDRSDPYLNLCSGCLKVYRLSDSYLGIQNGIYEKSGKSHSAIIMLSSQDGLEFHFERVLVEPSEDIRWMRQFVYASHLIYFDGKLRLYFNARDTSNPLRGRECIGFCEAEI